MANKTLQFLRNATIYASHEAAVSGLQAQLASAVTAGKSGAPIIARYTGEDTKEHILFGIAGDAQYEIFDNAGSNKAIEDAIAALDATASQAAAAGNGMLSLSVTEVDGKITAISGSITANTYDAYGAATAAVEALDATVDSTGGTNVAVQVVEADGVITGVTVTDNSINATDLTNAIEALDKSDSAVSGQFVTAVSEADGVITVSRDNLTDAVLAGYAADTSKTGAIAATDTLEQALNKLENKTAAITVASADGTIDVTSPAGGGTDLSVNIDGTTIVKANDGTLSADLTLAKLTAAEVTALSDANVKEAYKVIYATDSNRTAIGDVVKVYKDSSLYNVYLGHTDDTITSTTDPTVVSGSGDTALCFIYQKADGTYELVAVNVESFLQESEFSDGLQVNNHVVSVKLDTSGDDTGTGKFLTLSSNGLKLDGVTDAIAAAVNALDATPSQAAGADGLALSLTEVDGVVTAISGSIAANTYDAYGAASTAKSEVIGASGDASTANTIYGAKAYADSKVSTVVNGLDYTDSAVANQFVTSVSETDGVISVTRAQPAAAGVTVADSAGYFDATDVEDALAELAEFNCGTY